MGPAGGVSTVGDGEILVWPSAGIGNDFCRRKLNGTWLFGAQAQPTFLEVEDNPDECLDQLLTASLLNEARGAHKRHRLQKENGREELTAPGFTSAGY
ncbi:MAG: hypothetical protein ACR2OZ_14905 [Verrucomicrobiales bacterium]